MNQQSLRKVGHNSQLFGIEEHRLCGGRAEGMKVVVLRNGRGLTVTLQPTAVSIPCGWNTRETISASSPRLVGLLPNIISRKSFCAISPLDL